MFMEPCAWPPPGVSLECEWSCPCPSCDPPSSAALASAACLEPDGRVFGDTGSSTAVASVDGGDTVMAAGASRGVGAMVSFVPG